MTFRTCRSGLPISISSRISTRSFRTLSRIHGNRPFLIPRTGLQASIPRRIFPTFLQEADLTPMWNIVHNRNVQTLVTQSPSPVEGPYFDTAKTLHNIDKLAVESITPRMTLPKSDKKVIAVGLFPAEFWDISSQSDVVQISLCRIHGGTSWEKSTILESSGTCAKMNLKLRNKPKNHPVVCYQPTVYMNRQNRVKYFDCNQGPLRFFPHLKHYANYGAICHGDGHFPGITTGQPSTQPIWSKNPFGEMEIKYIAMAGFHPLH